MTAKPKKPPPIDESPLYQGKPFAVKVGKKEYTILMQQEGEGPLSTLLEEPFIAADTETTPIVNGEAPIPALLQVCYPLARTVVLVPAERIDWYVDQIHFIRPDIEWVFHNEVFDMHVIGLDKHPWLFEKLRDGQTSDVGIRFCLHGLETGNFTGRWALDYISSQMLGIKMEKDDVIRLSFKPGVGLTERKAKYAGLDPAITAEIRMLLPDRLVTEHIQLLGHFVLNNIEKNGMLVDREYMTNLTGQLLLEQENHARVLADYGWFFKKKGNQDIVQDILQNIEKRWQLKLARTPKSGRIKSGEKDLGKLLKDCPKHPFLKAYAAYHHIQKNIKTYCDPDKIAKDGRVHPSFTPIKRTGRTSCKGPNLQNLPRKHGIRGIYIAPPGYCLASVDYAQLELCTLAESCFSQVGFSKLGDAINDDKDVHAMFGREIALSEGKEPDSMDPKAFKKKYRQMAKCCNFGLPGGMGAEKFMDFAEKTYEVVFDPDFDKAKKIAEDLKQLWFNTFPEMEKYLVPLLDTARTKANLDEFCQRHKLEIPATVTGGQSLREYFREVNKWPDEQMKAEIKKIDAFMARTVSGRTKRNCTFCSACNYPFQALAADGAKLMLWNLYQAGFKIVNFIHDEVLVELAIDDQLQSNVKRITDIMVSSMSEFVKRVKIKAEPCLMTRWYKEAEPVYDEAGNLLIWTPGTK